MTEQEQVQPEVSQEVSFTADVSAGAFVDMWAVKIVDGKYFKIKVGLSNRAATPEAAFNGLVDAVKKIESKYPGFTPYNPDEFRVVVNKTDPQPQVPATPAAPAPAGAKAVPVPAPVTPAPAATPATGGGAVEVNKITVTPNAEGKTKIEFWKTGRKYAEVYQTWTPEQATAMFAKLDPSWTVDKFSKPGTFEATFTVEFIYSTKLTAKGNPYKDIVDLRP
jgi:hypothetical protein